MAQHSFLLFFFMFFFFVSTLFLVCKASEDKNSKIHIIYMGSLPEKASYDPISHHLSMLQRVIGTNDASNHLVRSYHKSFNGFAARLNEKQKEKLSNMEGVISVFQSKKLHLRTTRSWDFLGFQLPIKRSLTTESDVVVGVIDTGIWPESESFNDEGFSPVPKKWKGICAGGSNFTCNKKIIGARVYDSEATGDNSTRDIEGHGTHTASTIAGKEIKGASFYGLAQGTARGGVPSARIAAYKACHPDGCSEVDILAAFEDCIADGVDIISTSLGSLEPSDFDTDVIAIGAFHAMEKGILTVQSAGNDGPKPYSVESVAPWILTVGASSIDRQFIDKVILANGETLYGKSINAFSSHGKMFPIAVPPTFDKMQCSPELGDDNCDCLDMNMVKGKIVFCPKSTEEILASVSGSVGYISQVDNSSEMYNDVSYVTSLPALILEPKEYSDIRKYAYSTQNPSAKIMKSETLLEDKSSSAPKVASFSSRGPNAKVEEILKPDVCAPGIDILAAYSPTASPSDYVDDPRKVNYNILSGTSMACPHVAGVAGYVKAFHPNWSPAAIKSAIMTTAQPIKDTYGPITLEFGSGAGNVNPRQATDPGLVYDISKDDYVQMLCNFGYDAKKLKTVAGVSATCKGTPDRSLVKDLNYPALVIPVEPMKPFSFKVHRTVTNVGSPLSSYNGTIAFTTSKVNITVDPNHLNFKELNEKRSFVVTIVGEAKSRGVVFSSSLVWSDGIHNVKSPIIVLDSRPKNMM